MPEDVKFWIQILIYGVTIGSLYGSIRTRLNYIEKKLEAHNHFSDRLNSVEKDVAVLKKLEEKEA